ncbi:hypothetical protein TSUD_07850 [Trifolium subterraneum]|uniref:Uncharacterized protein n=1 Tax=Trifolium subterraneum TaxID=3900 RepID=A0A2Z6LJQ7_TRISU|nr:hypothetical protein TSUD_07850 [Trifolium subterraneum]
MVVYRKKAAASTSRMLHSSPSSHAPFEGPAIVNTQAQLMELIDESPFTIVQEGTDSLVLSYERQREGKEILIKDSPVELLVDDLSAPQERTLSVVVIGGVPSPGWWLAIKGGLYTCCWTSVLWRCEVKIPFSF